MRPPLGFDFMRNSPAYCYGEVKFTSLHSAAADGIFDRGDRKLRVRSTGFRSKRSKTDLHF
jgi:hypothetical protein